MKKSLPILTLLLITIVSGCAQPSTLPAGDTLSLSPEPKAMPTYPRYKEIAKPAGYVNTDKVVLGDLVGKKVILLDFVTYSCINCIRTFPYLKAWYEKYKDAGLEIVAIHTPEFAFEKKRENVMEAMQKHGLTFPVVLDNEYATWRAYGNNYWPRKYLIDIHGNIVYDHIGEGAYDETEKKIQEALEERRLVLAEENMVIAKDMAAPTNTEPVERGHMLSPEMYFGFERNEYLGNGQQFVPGSQSFTIPAKPKVNMIYLDGNWDIASEYAKNTGTPAKILLRYSARRVNIVGSADEPVRLRILRDGQPVATARGADEENGFVEVDEEDLYELIDDPAGYGEHTLEIEVLSPGLQVFTFTFG